MFVQDHQSLEELQRLTKALTKKRIWLRHQAWIAPGQAGPRRPAIARALGCSRRAVQAWGRPLQRGGPGGSPGEAPHRTPASPGRGGCAAVPRPPRGRAHPRGWRLHLPLLGLAPHPGGGIRRELAPEAIYDLLHRLDYSSLMPGSSMSRPTRGRGILKGDRRRADRRHRRCGSRGGDSYLFRG